MESNFKTNSDVSSIRSQVLHKQSTNSTGSYSFYNLEFNNFNNSITTRPLSWISAGHEHRRELTMEEQLNFDMSMAQLTTSSKTSALFAGFTMICLVELQYSADLPRPLLIALGLITALLVSIHLLALMISTCILPFIEASREARESPHQSLKIYINLAWFFSTCVGLIVFLIEIGLIFYSKLRVVGFEHAGLITSAVLIPVLLLFIIISSLIHRKRRAHSIDRIDRKVKGLKEMLGTCDEHISFLKAL